MQSQAKLPGIKAQFYDAQNDDAQANKKIGISFYKGEKGFPKDLTQALKHYLRAFLKESSTHKTKELSTLSLTMIIGITEELETGEPFSFNNAKKTAAAKLKTDSMVSLRKNAQEKLAAIEELHGKFSDFEKQICAQSAPSLKALSLKYIVKNISFFSQETQRLPLELQEQIRIIHQRSNKPARRKLTNK